MTKGRINKIIPFSSVDGPGNRTAIFLQGCNINCLYCHNPETINICNNCGKCINACEFDALYLENEKVVWDKKKCKDCSLCIKRCLNNSTPKTLLLSVNEVLYEIKKYSAFISGITVSGGECTLQHEFLTKVFMETKKLGLTNFIDTNGTTPLYDFKNLIRYTDKVMIDIKSFDNEEHEKLTGESNKVVLENARFLSSINKLYEVRTVIVPNVLDNYNNIDNISKLIANLNPNIRYKIIKYRPIGVRTNLIDSFTPDEKIIKELVDLAIKNGCKNVVYV